MEGLEQRCLLAVTLSLGGAQDIIPGTVVNATSTDPPELDHQATYQNEMTVAINPRNPLEIVGFSHTGLPNIGDPTFLEVFRSTNGGNTWTPLVINKQVDGLGDFSDISDPVPDGVRDPAEPYTDTNGNQKYDAGEPYTDSNGDGEYDDAEPWAIRFDPTLTFDDSGRLYVAYGHKLPKTTDPQRLHVLTRGNGASSFSNQGTDIDTAGALDKWQMASGPRVNAQHQVTGNAAYIAYSKGTTSPTEVWAAGSDDGGATWTLSGNLKGSGTTGTPRHAHPAVGPDGRLYVAWHNTLLGFPGTSTITVDTDPDGMEGGISNNADVVVRSLAKDTFATAGVKPPAQPDRGISNAPTITVDRSGGSYNGRAYITFCDNENFSTAPNDFDTFVTVSTNGGATWGTPSSPLVPGALRVETPAPGSTEFHPWVAVDQTSGLMGMAYYSSAIDSNGGNDDVGFRVAVSNDGGASYSFDWLSGTATSNETGGSGDDYLEYSGLALYGGTAHGFWSFRDVGTDLEAFTTRASFNSSTNGNLLTITGSNTNGAVLETIELRLSAANTSYLEVLIGGVRQYAGLLATIDQIVVDSQAGNDTVLLNFANGNLLAGLTSVSVIGGAGTDSIGISADQNMTLTNSSATIGSFGSVTLSGFEGAALTGGNGANTLDASAASLNDTLSGGGGNDILKGGTGPDIFNGDGGNDIVTYAHRTSGNLTISIDNVANDGATSEGDNISTTVEEVIGGSGNDSMSSSVAGSGGVTLRGGPGADTLTGGVGADNLFGDAGIDYINGDPTRTGSGGHDFIDGGDDGDFCFGGSGNDTLVGGNGADNLWGDGGDDKFRTADNGTQDILHGGDGDDWAPFPGDSDSNRDSNDQKPDNDIEHW